MAEDKKKKKEKKSWGDSDDFSLGNGMAENARQAIKNRRNQLDGILDDIENRPKKKAK